MGARKLEAFQGKVAGLDLKLENTGKGVLNHNCGADFVQKGLTGQSSLPEGFSNISSSLL